MFVGIVDEIVFDLREKLCW